MEKEKKEQKLGDALMKVALGFQVAEVTEEYAEVDGQLKLTKRKKTKKDVPPDLKAVQILLEQKGGSLGQMSDEELEKEKARLMELLRLQTEDGGQVCVEIQKKKATVVRKPRAKPRKRVVRKTKTEDVNGD